MKIQSEAVCRNFFIHFYVDANLKETSKLQQFREFS